MEIAGPDSPSLRFRIPILLALLIAALFMGPFGILSQFDTTGIWTFLPVIIFFVALEAIYTTVWLAHPDRRGTEKWVFRLGELVLLIVLLRFAAWMSFGGVPDEARLMSYLLEPGTIFDGTFLLYLGFGGFAWGFGVYWSFLFIKMALHGDEASFYALPLKKRRELDRLGQRPIFAGRPLLYAGFVKSWAAGGTVLVFTLGLASFDLQDLGDGSLLDIGRSGLPPLTLAGVLVYFFVGLWLLSHARYQMLSVRWTVSGSEVDDSIRRQWHRIMFILLGAVGLVAAFMPIGSTVALQRLAEALLLTVLFIANAIVLIFAALVALPFLLLGNEPPAVTNPLPPPVIVPPAQAPAAAPGNDPLLMGVLFWGIIILSVTTILISYLRERGYPLNAETARKLWNGLKAMLAAWWQWLRSRSETLVAALPSRPQHAADAEAGERRMPWRFRRINSLSPREQVRFFYLAAVRRATEQGVERRPAETPLEYTNDLVNSWPEAEQDVETLTEAFLHARYSPQPVADEEAGLVKQTWKRVRRALRRDTTRPGDHLP